MAFYVLFPVVLWYCGKNEIEGFVFLIGPVAGSYFYAIGKLYGSFPSRTISL